MTIPADFFGTPQARYSSRSIPSVLAQIKTLLDEGVRSVGINVISDSTGNDTSDWPYILAQKLAAQYPTHTVEHRFFNSTSQDWDDPVTLQTGAAGERYVTYTGPTSNATGRSWPSGEVGTIANAGLVITAKLAATDWTPAGNMTIAAQYQTTGNQRSWWLHLGTNGKLYMRVSSNGTAEQIYTDTNALGYADGSTHWVRVVFRGDNGSGASDAKFYDSADGSTWALRSTQTGTVTAVFATTGTPIEVGSHRGTDTEPTQIATWGGDIYECIIQDGSGGPLIAPYFQESGQIPNLSGRGLNTVKGSPKISFWTAAVGGQDIAYWTDSARFPKATPRMGCTGHTIVSLGHNERQYGYNQWSALDSLYAQWKARIKVGQFALMTQNPRNVLVSTSPEIDVLRNYQDIVVALRAWCVRNLVECIDINRAFQGQDLNTLINADTVHPVLAGSTFWADAVLEELNLA